MTVADCTVAVGAVVASENRALNRQSSGTPATVIAPVYTFVMIRATAPITCPTVIGPMLEVVPPTITSLPLFRIPSTGSSPAAIVTPAILWTTSIEPIVPAP